MDIRDYSKNYKGDQQGLKTTKLVLVDSNGNEVEVTGDQLTALLALLSGS